MIPSEKLYAIAVEWSELDALNSYEVLPFAEKALRLISENPECRADFIRAFDRILSIPKIDLDFIAVCVHALRWPELKSNIEARHQHALETNNLRSEPAFRDLLAAFDPNWLGDDRDLYYPDFFTKWRAT